MTSSETHPTTFDVVSDLEVVMTRVFDAPRELVYQVCTEAQHMAEWWGPAKLSLPVCEMDVRPGGTYRFVQRDDDGTEYPFRGEFREVVAPSRLVMTQIFEPYADHEMLVTLTFEDLGNGRTRLTDHMRFDTVESRDATLAAGMESGARESYDRMAALLARLSS
ncbi:MAG: SRPBCC family protein [Chloroflexi bacterium]|nr:SRPBCC family protein [Chloroflexota bacterium]